MSASGNNGDRRQCLRQRSGLFSYLLAIAYCLISPWLAAAELEQHRVEDLDYGRALYLFYQDNELSAITQLMVAQLRPRTRTQLDESELLMADLYYRYGLYEESRELFARLLSAELSASVQNRIWFNLARLRFEQGYYDHARNLLSRISDRLPSYVEAEKNYLLTNLYLGDGQFDVAADLSDEINPNSIWKVYARYNLGVSLIEEDYYQRGKTLLEQIGKMESTTPELLALRDRANLSLGLKQLRMELPQPALENLSRIRLQGPLSHQALLASGWAWYRLDQFDKALVPWRLLLRQNSVDPATQEAILAIPTNYAEAGQDALALRHYEVAAEQFDGQLQSLHQAIASIENNGLIAALRRHAILYDRSSLERQPPRSDVTQHLHLLLSSTEFQREIKRYQELLDIRNSLGYWDNSFPALELMLAERRRNFVQGLPKLQQSASFDQLENLRDQRDLYARQLATIEARQDHRALANGAEQEHLERIQRVQSSLLKIGTQRETSEQRDMLRLISGLLDYELGTDYKRRFWQAKKQLILLDRALHEADRRVSSLSQIAQRSEREFREFQGRIGGQLERIRQMYGKVTQLLLRQEQFINRLAIESIQQQQKHIVQLRLNARFELAKLYDKLAATE